MNSFQEQLQLTLEQYYESAVNMLPRLAISIVLLLILWFIGKKLTRTANRLLRKRMDDPLLADFLTQVIRIGVYILSLMIILSVLGLSAAASTIIGGAGLTAFVIGFAFKDIGENFLAGIIMAFKRPFNMGDVIRTGDISGSVVGMSLRDTQVKTFDGKDVFIPNGSIMKNPIINFTIDGFLRYDFSIGLDFDDDIAKGIEIIKKSVENTFGVLNDDTKKVSVEVTQLASSAVTTTVYFWVDMDDPRTSGTKVKSDAMINTVKTLSEHDYYLPADIIEIKNYSNTDLNTKNKQEEATNKAETKNGQ